MLSFDQAGSPHKKLLNLESENFAAFLNVTVEDNNKPIKGILKKKETPNK